MYLHPLGRTEVFNLGLVLGLDYSRLKSLVESSNFLNEMLAGWLQRVDQVQKAGVPTWRRLEEALRDPRVGQNGIASKMEQDKQWTRTLYIFTALQLLHSLGNFAVVTAAMYLTIYTIYCSMKPLSSLITISLIEWCYTISITNGLQYTAYSSQLQLYKMKYPAHLICLGDQQE